MAEDKLTHVDAQGTARMVDVGDKPDSTRLAVAAGKIMMQPETLRLIRENGLKKRRCADDSENCWHNGGKANVRIDPPLPPNSADPY